MDKETEILSRLAANHLYLAQFEPLRAVLQILRSVNEELSRCILQTIVSRSGRIDNVVFPPSGSCSSPVAIAYLSAMELLQYPDPTAGAWSFGSFELKARVEFLFLIQELIYKTEEGSFPVLDKLLELAVDRLKSDVDANDTTWRKSEVSVEEEEVTKLKTLVLDNPEVFDALCVNMRQQATRVRANVKNRIPIMPVASSKQDEEIRDDYETEVSEVFFLVLRTVQLAHLDAMNICLSNADDVGASCHVRYLQPDDEVNDAEYRKVLQKVFLRIGNEGNGYGNLWFASQEKVLFLYQEALSSKSTRLVCMIQDVQDGLISQVAGSSEVTHPLDYLGQPLKKCSETDLMDESLAEQDSLRACRRNLYHYARVSGTHVFEVLMKKALHAVRRESYDEANNVLVLYPRLRALVAAMGWDILSGNTIARRRLMHLLWGRNKLHGSRVEESNVYSSNSEEQISWVDHLCNTLCYHLDLSSFAACVNSGKTWDSNSSQLNPGDREINILEKPLTDSFAENFVLERLSVQSPLKVLFDVVPTIKYRDAVGLIGIQPIYSKQEKQKRADDIELIQMRYALQAFICALGHLEKNSKEEREARGHSAICYLNDMRTHLEAIENLPRKIFMVNIIISLLHMDKVIALPTLNPTGSCINDLPLKCSSNHKDTMYSERGNENIVSFIGLLLEILRHGIASCKTNNHDLSATLNISIKQSLDWRTTLSKNFIEDWQWRLPVLEILLPLTDDQWRWKEALSILHAAPSKLLNLCMQKAKYNIGVEAVERFSLSAEDKATLEIAEYVEGAFKRISESLVEDGASLAAGESASLQDLNLSSLCSQLSPLASIFLCIDVAVASARSVAMSKLLLDHGQSMLSLIYPGSYPKLDATYWDQILEVGIISVLRRVLKRLNEFLEQDDNVTIQEAMVGINLDVNLKSINIQGQKDRASATLVQMVEDAYKGKRQFLSGKLHNLARAIADEESSLDLLSEVKNDRFVGIGLRVANQSHSIGAKTNPVETLVGPISSKPATYLSHFILYIAAIGDIVDGTDTTHDFNYFSVIYEWPKDLLTRLVFDQGSSDAAGKAADIMHADFVHEIVSACVPPVYPARCGNGWACIPFIPSYSKTCVGSKALSPDSKDAKPNRFNYSSGLPEIPLYPLQLDIIRHLVKMSPVRAILASVFGSGILYSNSDSTIALDDSLLQGPDDERLFYEFALDQSERFPTLNRWIQLQTNLHRVSEFAVVTEQRGGIRDVQHYVKGPIKRLRERDSDSELELNEKIVGNNSPTSLSKFENAPLFLHKNSAESLASEFDSLAYLTLNWENEELCKKAVERLVTEGKLMDALALSDRFLRDGASDHLLKLIIECEEENSRHPQVEGSSNVNSNSWQYCLRLNDKHLAAYLAIKYLQRWELDAALDLLNMCSCHLSLNDSLKNTVLTMRASLICFSHILNADNQFRTWQEVQAECTRDPEGLALRLASKGAVSAALEVAESASLSVDLRRELQGRQLVKLLTADPLSGGGPAEASRFLSSLGDSADALPVAIGAMQLLPDLRSKQLLVHFFLKRKDGNLSASEVSRLNSWALGLRVLASLPLPWQQKCSSLHEYPHLILEVLLMRKQLRSAAQILEEFPQLRDTSVIASYAAKSIAVCITLPSKDSRATFSYAKTRSIGRTRMMNRQAHSSSVSSVYKEARRPFSWASRNYEDKVTSQAARRKRSSDNSGWETTEGLSESNALSHLVNEREQLPSIIAEEAILTGDKTKDETIRASHHFSGAPDIVLFKALLSLYFDDFTAAKVSLDLCVSQMKCSLTSQQLPNNASMEITGQSYYAVEAILQGLLYAKSLLKKLNNGTSEVPLRVGRSRDSEDKSFDAWSSSSGSPVADELSELMSLADLWLSRAELLQSLLGSGIAASLDDIANVESASRLCDRLVSEERYSMAVYTCRKCKIDVFPVWNAWGKALIRVERYAQARIKFKQAFQIYTGDPVNVIGEIINEIEGSPPVDVSSARLMYEHLAKSAPTILDDSLSADSYLNVLYMPSTFPRSERSRRSQESSSSNSNSSDVPFSNLDSVRYNECVYYLQEYLRPQLLGFMFRHGHFVDACMLFFPVSSVPTLSSSVSSSTTLKFETLATDYGTIDDLCELCIGYGAVSVLEELILARMTSSIDTSYQHHILASLARICSYCESHKLFNYLYKFQVIKSDEVDAGLTCIQLFMNSSSQEEAVKHLDRAKMHFDEGLSARYKDGGSTKLLTKGARGKSASAKLTEEGLVKFSARVSIQMEVVKSSNEPDKPLWQQSLFGNPNDPDTFKRRCRIAENLVEKNFDLAFQVIYEFNLPAVDIYAGVAASLADRKRGNQLTEFFRNIKGTIDDNDWDQVLGAAINVYANKHKERPDRLIDMLTSSHRKVLACVVCGRLKSAFQIASRSGSVADVQYVAHQALHANALPVLDMCKQWLSQYM